MENISGRSSSYTSLTLASRGTRTGAFRIGERAGERGAGLRVAYLVAVGLVLHDVPEGFAMANAYLAAPASGVIFAAAIAIHNVPEEFAMALPAAALASRRFLYGAGLASALAEPVGAGIGLVGIGAWPGLHPVFRAFAAGAMVYVALIELVPLVRRVGHVFLAFLGVALSIGVYGLLAVLVRVLAR
jgi:ZIP family zinc transporter